VKLTGVGWDLRQPPLLKVSTLPRYRTICSAQRGPEAVTELNNVHTIKNSSARRGCRSVYYPMVINDQEVPKLPPVRVARR